MPIIVDGYNLLFAFAGVHGYKIPKELEAARKDLLQTLGTYQHAVRQQITVVFDDRSGDASFTRSEKAGRIDVVFVRSDSDADSEIKRMVDESSAPKRLRVVSSDRAVRGAAERRKAESVPAGAFIEELAKTLQRRRSKLPPEPPAKFHGPSQAEVDYWMRIFGESETKSD